MEKNKRVAVDEPEINYRGWKAMSFIIEYYSRNYDRCFIGTANFGTLVGAFLCNTYFGHYKTLGFATSASFLLVFEILMNIMGGNETFEKLGAIRTLSNLLIYLTIVFNLKSITTTIMIDALTGLRILGSWSELSSTTLTLVITRPWDLLLLLLSWY
ncbi:hypothetical protein V6N11_044089 [Hibiscus sabdariffa]|uniref:Uncharacterized protein n=1 Tax=Hibiscus sabdariffa TaxID=183260 RepID=A0ABR2RE42_9ROSI